MSTPDELLRDNLYNGGGLFAKLDYECKEGNLPKDYLRALAKRAREESPPAKEDGTAHYAYRKMAETLEAWADE